jgi:hypothetical protein
MSRALDEPRSWPAEPDARAEAVLDDLRRQIEAVKARLEEHRMQMHAAGLTRRPERSDGGA